mmetsp:Transcript_21119/g.43413  ORF Transcript_21119/g.43413 Transcript_21119/m.43413 type:complete len:85 (-) Transcript_21119:22-276(-)
MPFFVVDAEKNDFFFQFHSLRSFLKKNGLNVLQSGRQREQFLISKYSRLIDSIAHKSINQYIYIYIHIYQQSATKNNKNIPYTR